MKVSITPPWAALPSRHRTNGTRTACQVFIVLASFAAIASASHLVAPTAPVLAAAVNTGSSSQYRSQDNLGQYSFGYDEAGATGGSFRHEKSDAYGNRVGSYGLTGADGRVRIVNYVADANGYRANIQTNEPGTEPRDPAAVAINKATPMVAAPLPVPVAAPVVAASAASVALAAPAPLPVPVAAAAPLPLAAPALPLAPAPLAAPLPVAFNYGFSVLNHHVAPLPLAAPLPAAGLVPASY